MKANRQTIKHDPDNGQYGDCARTCIACILDLEPEQVPHFLKDGCNVDTFYRRMDTFLAKFGLISCSIPFECSVVQVLKIMGVYNPNVVYMLGYESPVAKHFVVCRGDQVVCDPALDTPDVKQLERGKLGFLWVILLAKAEAQVKERDAKPRMPQQFEHCYDCCCTQGYIDPNCRRKFYSKGK